LRKWLSEEQLCTHYVQSIITLGGACSDTATVTSCSRPSQHVKSWIATNWIKFSLSLVPAILHLQRYALGKRLNK